jgi:hypothetical protein
MCEQLSVRADEPFALADLWEMARRLEQYGIAGFGWGASWVTADGGLATHRSTSAFRDDPEREAVGRETTTAALVHLRRPSKLSTVSLADTQPFADPAGRFAFSHNGELRDHRAHRPAYALQGRLHGRADSEVGARWLEDAWEASATSGRSPGALLAALHAAFGGPANFALLLPDGSSWHYAGNAENPVFGFRLGRFRVLSTAAYSIDRSFFRLVAPGARERRVVRDGEVAAL